LALLELRRVSAFSGHRAVLSDVSFSVERGTLVGVTGPSGAGQGAVLDAISGLRRPDRGEVLFQGVRLGRLSPGERCRLGLVRLFARDPAASRCAALDHAAAGALARAPRVAVAREIGAEALRTVGLLPRAAAAVLHLDPLERRRLSLARGLAARPELLLVEEPLRGLDPAGCAALLDLLRDLCRTGLTLVVATADPRAALRAADRVVVLRTGEKLCEGTPQQVADDRAVAAAYLGEAG
jgi:branched-chain amino acid transport system ATP-binding protein